MEPLLDTNLILLRYITSTKRQNIGPPRQVGLTGSFTSLDGGSHSGTRTLANACSSSVACLVRVPLSKNL